MYDISIFLVAVHLLRGISIYLREPSTNSHLAITPHPKQDLEIDALDYNDSISLRSHFFYPSHLGFCHPWLIPMHQVDFHAWSRRFR